jgi:hypothetical protein
MIMIDAPYSPFNVNDHVMKVGEDSIFEGYVVSVFFKRNGHTKRYVVENNDGVLHIASQKQLRWIADEPPSRAEKFLDGLAKLRKADEGPY